MQKEADFRPCQESGGLDEWAALVKHCCHLQHCVFKEIFEQNTRFDEKHNTKFLEDILRSVTLVFMKAFFNQISVVGKERPIIPDQIV